MKFSEILKEALEEAKKKKPSSGLTKKEKSAVVKKAKAGKDIGKKGKGFEKIASKAAEKYGSKEKGEKVAAAAMWKNIKRENLNEAAVDPKALEAIVAALMLTMKTIQSAKLFGNIPDVLKAWKDAGNDAEKKKEVLKLYAMHILNPFSNPIKKLFSKEENPQNIGEGQDHEVSMAQNSIKSIMKSCADLMNKLGNEERDIPGWIQDHITNAENFIDQAAQGFHELGHHEEEEDEDNGMIEPVDEKKLTKAEKAKKEEIIKAMAKKGGGKEKMGPKQYAIATAQAIKSAE